MTETERPALELTIYPPAPAHPCPGVAVTRMSPHYRAYQEWAEHERMVGFRQRAKQLTDAELAAEYWRAGRHVREYIKADGTPEYVYERDIIERIASRPHASSKGYE